MSDKQQTASVHGSEAENTSWWKTVLTVIGASAAFITALTGLLVALHQIGILLPPTTALKPQDGLMAAKSAKVNSPNDGFLAIRSVNSTITGDQLGKIPHGASVLAECRGDISIVENKKGHWCWVNYNGVAGWIFDGYLIYQD